MRPVVYSTRPADLPGFERLHAVADVRVDDAALQVAHGILCFPGDPVGEPLLARAPKVRTVATASVGFDHVDLAACTARGLVVSHTPGVLTDATAELTFALLLSAGRRVVEADAFVRAGSWSGFRFDLLLGAELAGATLGIVGAGRIGQAVAARARAFRMRRVFANPSPRPALEADGATRLPLGDLLEVSDFISLHVPLSPATHHLIGREELARMRPGAVLVNTSRGPVIDEGALVEGLGAGRPAAAGLDVFEDEPSVHPGLLALPNVVLLPHLGSATARTRRRMAELAAENLCRSLAGRAPRHPIATGGSAP